MLADPPGWLGWSSEQCVMFQLTADNMSLTLSQFFSYAVAGTHAHRVCGPIAPKASSNNWPCRLHRSAPPHPTTPCQQVLADRGEMGSQLSCTIHLSLPATKMYHSYLKRSANRCWRTAARRARSSVAPSSFPPATKGVLFLP